MHCHPVIFLLFVLFFEQNFPRNRAALSLLSYCYYQMQDYKAATTMYEQLVKVCPSVEEYKVREELSNHMGMPPWAYSNSYHRLQGRFEIDRNYGHVSMRPLLVRI